MSRVGGKNRIPLEGLKIHHWNVQAYLGDSKYLCKCTCGTTRAIEGSKLVHNLSKSCGCMAGVRARKQVVIVPYKPTDKVE